MFVLDVGGSSGSLLGPVLQVRFKIMFHYSAAVPLFIYYICLLFWFSLCLLFLFVIYETIFIFFQAPAEACPQR